MKNEVFKAQVARLFEKVALHDPAAVAAASPGVGPAVNRGLGVEQTLRDAGGAAKNLLFGGARSAKGILTSGGDSTTKGLAGVSDFVQAHPKGALTAAALASILPGAFDQSQHRFENELMTAYRDPDSVHIASLDEFLEKKAAGLQDAGFMSHMMQGTGKALGTGVVTALLGSLGHHLSNTKNVMFDEPKRKALLDQLFRTDPVIKDALARHPDSKTMLMEAYGTMAKFAPTLSMDINAARSFLREAVLGGSGVNYASIKNLVDTERAIADSKPKYGGK